MTVFKDACMPGRKNAKLQGYLTALMSYGDDVCVTTLCMKCTKDEESA